MESTHATGEASKVLCKGVMMSRRLNTKEHSTHADWREDIQFLLVMLRDRCKEQTKATANKIWIKYIEKKILHDSGGKDLE